MEKIGLFYGSSMDNTKSAAEDIMKKLGVDNVEIKDVSNATREDVEKYKNLIFGSSTWGAGDLQDDWETFIGKLDKIDFTGKKVAIFGLGDQMSYPDTFVDAIGTIYEKIKTNGAEIIGFISTDGYEFTGSTAVVDNKFVGLVLDEDNQSDLSDERITKWTEQLSNDFN